MNKIIITERQLEVLTNLVLNEEEISSEVTSHPYYKMFMKKLSKTSQKIWENIQKTYLKKGLTMDDEERLEILNKFQDRLEKYKKGPKKTYRKIKKEGIRLRGKNLPAEVIVLDDEETTIESCPTIQFNIDGIGDKDYNPFENNSFNLGKGLKDDIQVLVDDIKGLQDNYGGKLKIKVLEFDVKTSASRIRNGGKYSGKSFAKLSADRTVNVVNTITKALQNIGVEVPTAATNSKGKNGDGSSGPHPKEPYKMVKDEGDSQTVDDNQDRNAYGSPLNNDADYDKFKFCIVNLVITGKVEGDEDKGEVKSEEVEQVINQSWKMSFSLKKGFDWPDWRISFKKRYKNPRRRKITSKMLTRCPKW